MLPLILFALFFILLTIAVVSARAKGGDAHATGPARWERNLRVTAGSGVSTTSDPAYVPRAIYEAAQRKSWKRLKRAVRAERRRNGLRAILLHRSSVSEALNLACTVYGNCSTLWRRARCESHLNPSAHNGSEASGLLQFLPSTWRSTPYARFSIYSPYANALAAGWMHRVGRGEEWSCR